MRHLLPISCLLLASSAFVCLGQDQFVSFGVKAGVPATPALPGLVSSNEYLDTGRWTVGPSFELHIISGLSFEADALFRGYTTFLSFAYIPSGTSQTSPVQDTYKASVKAWDFPLLAKYRFTGGAIRPFVDGGFQLTHESTDTFASSAILSGTNLGAFTDFNGNVNGSRNLHGPVGGMGVEFRYHRFKFAPEIRYHYTNADKNQLTALVGVSF
jgi:hypothetical protein